MQRLIRHRISEVFELVAQGADPQVRVLGQARDDVGQEHLEGVRDGAFTHSGCGGSVEVGPDGLAVAAGVPCDVGDLSASLMQGVYFHVFLPCKHEERVSFG